MTKEDKKETVSDDIDLDISSGAYTSFEGGFGVGGNDSNITITVPSSVTDDAGTVTFNDGQADLTLTIPRDSSDLHGGYSMAPISTHSTDVITVTNEDLQPTQTLLMENLTSDNYLEGEQGDLFDGWSKDITITVNTSEE
tara:strand:- start:2631 stop:3050 length:420 start_codon:yes stop_codon:yes gene_type:complete